MNKYFLFKIFNILVFYLYFQIKKVIKRQNIKRYKICILSVEFIHVKFIYTTQILYMCELDVIGHDRLCFDSVLSVPLFEQLYSAIQRSRTKASARLISVQHNLFLFH